MKHKNLRSGTASDLKITPKSLREARAVPASDLPWRGHRAKIDSKADRGVLGGAISTFLGLALWTTSLVLAARWGFKRIFDE